MKFLPSLPIRSCASLAALALATGLSGCLSDPDSRSNPATNPTSSPAQNTAEGIYGSVLYSKDLGGKHNVEFYDFGDGNTAIRESGSMDESAKPILPSMQISSLEDAYRKLNPNASSVPQEILSADLAAVAKAWEPGASVELTAAPGSSNRPLAKTATQQCSADAYGDGWGGDWFNLNFCVEGRFRWCQKNFGWANSNDFSHSWSKWMQMEGDFNVSGHIFATIIRHHWYGDDLRTAIMDHDIFPRRWEAWSQGGSDTYNYRGTSPCGHLHVNFMWN